MEELKTHWRNPWPQAISIPLEDLADLMAGKTVVPWKAHTTIHTDRAYWLESWAQHGDKLDAYLLETTLGRFKRPSAGLRFGPQGHHYLSPYIPSEKLAAARALIAQYKRILA